MQFPVCGQCEFLTLLCREGFLHPTEMCGTRYILYMEVGHPTTWQPGLKDISCAVSASVYNNAANASGVNPAPVCILHRATPGRAA